MCCHSMQSMKLSVRSPSRGSGQTDRKTAKMVPNFVAWATTQEGKETGFKFSPSMDHLKVNSRDFFLFFQDLKQAHKEISQHLLQFC